MAGVAPSSPAGTIGTVSSRKNPVVQRYRELAREGAADDRGARLLLDGMHLLTEARAAGLTIESAAFAPRVLETPDGQSLAHALARAGTSVLAVPDSVLSVMSPVRTPSGVVAVAVRPGSSPDAVLKRSPQLVALAVDVQDSGNLGAVVRAVEAAGGTGLLACGRSADPFGWKALRGSMGSAFRLPVARAGLDEAIAACRAAGVRLLAAVPRGGEPLFDLDLRPPLALILGTEGRGLPEPVLSRADARVSIPMHPPVESLNVAVAAAVFFYEACRQRLVPAESASAGTVAAPPRDTMEPGELFDLPPAGTPQAGTPLAERMRPATFDELVGQEEILGPGRPLREAIERDLLQSIVLWGPPGTGKTTLARLIAGATRARFVAFSAVLSGIKEIRDVMAAAQQTRRQTGRRTILFIDEIHRFNKAQQDAFLPRVEAGDIVLVGATTENPSFEVNAALLSRSKVFVLRALDRGGNCADPPTGPGRSRQGARIRAGRGRARRAGGHRAPRQRRRPRGASTCSSSPWRVRGPAARPTGRPCGGSTSPWSSRPFSGGRCCTTSRARSTST